MLKRSCSFGCIVYCASLLAQPQGFHSIAGDVALPTIDARGHMLIQSGDKAIIHWDSFSIGANEQVRFQQADARSAILNRVVGGEASSLLGLLTSNGRVFLINPNGVLIGPGGRIEAAGFLASTFDVLDEAFLQGNPLYFSAGSEKSIHSLGSITCPGGNIHLFAAHVINEGDLKAERVTLASGGDILLQKDGSVNILIRPDLSEETVEGAAIDHRGAITALTVELQAGKSPYEKAIQCSGKIDASVMQEIGGQIYLVAEKGIVEVDNGHLTARGGTVHVFGEKVGLQGNAKIDVSSIAGGGTVLIGGDFQGKNPDIQNAIFTYVGQDAEIKVDALENGNGGRVIVWSDEATYHYGQISARGGELGGDGGFVEVSGKNLDFHGLVDTRAPLGEIGTLFLDPNDIEIKTAVVTTGTFSVCVPPKTYNIVAGTPTNLILNTDLNAQLATCNVTISTVGSGGVGPFKGRITVSDPITWSVATTLSLIADANIVVNAPITSLSPVGLAGIRLTANASGASTGAFSGIDIAADLTCGGVGGGNIFLLGKAGQTGPGVGVAVAANIECSIGSITFSNCLGGQVGSNNYGVEIKPLNIVKAPTITATNITGGNSTGIHNYGFRVAGTMGDSTLTTNLSLGTSLTPVMGGGIGAGAHGIVIEGDGAILVNDTGMLSLFGAGSVTLGVAAPTCGINMAGGTISGGNNAHLMFTGTGGGEEITITPIPLTRNCGIEVSQGTISVGDAGSISFQGYGGKTNAGKSNNGVNIHGPMTSIIAGISDTSTATIKISGTGGTGDTFNYIGPALLADNGGVVTDRFSHGSHITLHGTGTILFSDCKAYMVTDQQGPGLKLQGYIEALNGSVVFENCQGGNAASADHGIHLFANANLAPTDYSHIYAKTIIAFTGIVGGRGEIGGTIADQNSAGIYLDGVILGHTMYTDSIIMEATALGASPDTTGVYFDNLHSAIVSVKDTGNIYINGTGGPGNPTVGCCNVGIYIGGPDTQINGGIITLVGHGKGSGVASSSHGILMDEGVMTSPSNSSSAITFQGYGGVGTAGGHCGTMIMGGSVLLTGTGTATFSGTGGTSGVGNTGGNIGVQIGSTLATHVGPPNPPPDSVDTILFTEKGSFVFSSCIGGPNGDGNVGLHITTSANISAPTITATNAIYSTGDTMFESGIRFTFDVGNGTGKLPMVHVPNGGTLTMRGIGSATGIDQSYGILLAASLNGPPSYGSGTGTIYGGNSSTISLTGIAGNGNGVVMSDFHGFHMGGGTILVGDAGSIFITGSGGLTAGGQRNVGVYADGGTIMAGITGGNPSYITFNGTAGTGSLGGHIGVELTKHTAPPPVTVVTLMLNSPGNISFSGSVPLGNNGVGVKIDRNTITATSGQVIFSDCFGGNANILSNNFGVQLTGGAPVTIIDAEEILATNVVAGNGQSKNIGFYINGATLGTTNTNSIDISAQGNGSLSLSGQNDGIRIDTSSVVQVNDNGGIRLNGTGGQGTVKCKGVYLSDGMISGGLNSQIILIGIGGGSTGIENVGFQMDSGTTITSTSNFNFPSAVKIIGTGGNVNSPYRILMKVGSTIQNTTGYGNISLIGTGGNNVIALEATSITSTLGGISFIGPVQLLGSPTISAGAGGAGAVLSFSSTIDGAQDLTLTASDPITVSGNIGLTTPLKSLTMGAGGNISCQWIRATDPLGATVTLSSTGGSISVANIDTSGVVGGNISLRPGSGSFFSPTFGNVPQGTLTFTGTSVMALGSPNGMISLSPDALAMPMSIATIIGLNNLVIQGGTIVMGQNQSMTVLGNLTINATGPLTVCDIVSPNQITLTGSSTSLLPQVSAQYLHHVGGLYISPSAHIIGGVAPSVAPALSSIDQRVDTDGTLNAIRLHYLDTATVLNYDLNEASSLLEFLFLEQIAIYQLAVANTQLGSLLPMLHVRPCHCPIVRLPHGSSIMLWSNQNRSSNFQPFIFESDILTRTGP